jgi:hypothetical protein
MYSLTTTNRHRFVYAELIDGVTFTLVHTHAAEQKDGRTMVQARMTHEQLFDRQSAINTCSKFDQVS